MDEVARRAKPLPPFEEMLIKGLTDDEEAAFLAALNE